MSDPSPTVMAASAAYAQMILGDAWDHWSWRYRTIYGRDRAGHCSVELHLSDNDTWGWTLTHDINIGWGADLEEAMGKLKARLDG